MNMNSLIHSVDSSFGSRSDSSQSSVNSVSITTPNRFSREHDERTVGVTYSKLSQKSQSRVDLFGVVLLLLRIKRWSCSSKRHGCSGKWWSCGKHGYPPFKLDSMYQVVRLMLSLKRWRKIYLIKHAMQKKDCLAMSLKQGVARVVPDKLDGTSNNPIRKRKRTVLPFGLVKIREDYGKTMEKTVANLGVGISKLRGVYSNLGMQRCFNKLLKSNQANVVIRTSEEALTSVFAASSEPLATTNVTRDRPTLVLHQQQTNLPDGDGLAQFKTIMREQFIQNATASSVKVLTIKATYKDNMVTFQFTLLDGLEKLNEMVATRFQLRLESFKLTYVDEDGDMILIACDTDLMLLVGDPRQPINQPVTRLSVLPIAHASNDA